MREPRCRRDLGSYRSELDILQAMMNEHTGALLVKFKPSAAESDVDVVGSTNENLDNDSTVVLANPDGLKALNYTFANDGLAKKLSHRIPHMYERG